MLTNNSGKHLRDRYGNPHFWKYSQEGTITHVRNSFTLRSHLLLIRRMILYRKLLFKIGRGQWTNNLDWYLDDFESSSICHCLKIDQMSAMRNIISINREGPASLWSTICWLTLMFSMNIQIWKGSPVKDNWTSHLVCWKSSDRVILNSSILCEYEDLRRKLNWVRLYHLNCVWACYR